MTTLTLTEFLLARIAEDEARALELKRRVEGDPGSYVSLGLDHAELAAGDAPSYLGEYDPDRALAECVAKRLIVESCRADYEYTLTRNDDTMELAEEVLYHLAAVYADHPDYDDSWRE